MIFWNFVVIFILIALNAFFVSVEFAAVASRRARLDILPGADGRAGRLARNWLENPATRDRLIAATQLAITMIGLALGAIGEKTFAQIIEPLFAGKHLPGAIEFLDFILPALPLILSLGLITALEVVLGEQVPKMATLRAPEQFALFAAPVMHVFIGIFRWFVDLLDWATHRILTLMGLPASNPHSSVYSLEEIKQIVAGPEAEGVIQQPEREMLSAVFDFGELVVRQVALPRTEIVAIDADASLPEMISLATHSTVTKFPVYEGNLDQILGILHVRDLLNALLDPQKKNVTARALAREGLFVPETISVNDLLREFRSRHQHIAIVLDEFGGTAGLVTLEDLVEEIVGEFRGPFDAAPPAIQVRPDGSALVDGLTLIEEINDHFGLHLFDPNYDTIAGYVLGRMGRIPQVGDVVESKEDGVHLKVETMDGLRISQIELRRLAPKAAVTKPA